MAVVDRSRYDSMRAAANASDSRRRSAEQSVRIQQERLDKLSLESKGLSASEIRSLQSRFDKANQVIQSEIETVRVNYERQLKQQSYETKQMIAEVRKLAENNKTELADVKKKISSLEAKVNIEFQKIKDDQRRKKEQAIYYYEGLSNLVDKISLLSPEKFELLYPEILQPKYYTFKETLCSILESINKGNYEAAIGMAQTRTPEAVSILAQLEYYNEIFNNTKRQTDIEIKLFLEKKVALEDEHITTVKLKNGDEYDDKYGVPYWTREIYSEISAYLDKNLEQYAMFVEALDTEGLLSIQNSLKRLSDQLNLCEKLADNERVLSYECYDLAANIYEILNKNDPDMWKIESVYSNEDDLREPTYLLLKMTNGKITYHITIICYPERSVNPNNIGCARCEIEVFDQQYEKDDLSRCDTFYRKVITILKENGIEISSNDSDNKVVVSDNDLFVKQVFSCEGKTRNKWIDLTKKAIGLL